MKEKILIVEDQFIEANNLQMILERAGYHVCSIARSVPEAIEIVEKESPNIVLLDIHLKGKLTGIDLAKILRKKNIPFVYLSANSNTDILNAAKATRPYGFLVKPFRERDVLVTLDIARYLHEHSLESAVLNTPTYKSSIEYHEGIIGNNIELKKVLEHLRIVAPLETSVLILGESGTGKERIADRIHELSPRKSKPFVKVNCAALPDTLIESELFGHERGAFTGATEKRMGKFEKAADGTIFLDEIGEMPFNMQVKLLRVLQEKEIERIGGNTTIKINARIIAATNRDLEKEVAAGRFRIDLYYRLNAFPLTLPALRDRKEDIPLLANHFINLFSLKNGKKITAISEKVMAELMDYDWPGNIRELEHLIERSILLTEGTVINQISIPRHNKTQAATIEKPIKSMIENEFDNIIAALKKCGGKISGRGGAAELLNINVSTLNSKMKKLGIEKEMIFSK
ncbi:sigma-54-dependent transcriptional regulator [Lacibacter sediminis]|uniref:Sigma-54-dependent Fis family transcriptional regulator n=1 Tax=Lacibacter sediminis TaxID=2760713 RepID=A0A7G5XK89_9BACT|nr:sigma-54 dependent transcriptional regulator [Lacibacter sediminis]QNA45892.1 sigma-54-dependent Fis family transcriptional regulator [Lacibacter sediminis]